MENEEIIYRVCEKEFKETVLKDIEEKLNNALKENYLIDIDMKMSFFRDKSMDWKKIDKRLNDLKRYQKVVLLTRLLKF